MGVSPWMTSPVALIVVQKHKNRPVMNPPTCQALFHDHEQKIRWETRKLHAEQNEVKSCQVCGYDLI